MIQSCSNLGLVHGTLARSVIRESFEARKFDRDLAIKERVICQINHAIATAPELRNQLKPIK